jgi:NADH-quinone oxidoreductase subunit N
MTAALPEVFLAVATMALLMIGAYRGNSHTRTIGWFAVAVLVVAGGLVAGTAASPESAFGGMFVADTFARFAKFLVLIGSVLAVVLSVAYIEREDMARFEYPILFLFATIGMMMMISANDLIALYVGLELQSLAVVGGGAQGVRPRRAVVGHAALRRIAGLRFCRHDLVRRHRQGAGDGDG